MYASIACYQHCTCCGSEPILPSMPAVRTKNFSGAEIEGLVKAAVSYALNRQVDVSDLSKPIDEENIKVTISSSYLL